MDPTALAHQTAPQPQLEPGIQESLLIIHTISIISNSSSNNNICNSNNNSSNSSVTFVTHTMKMRMRMTAAEICHPRPSRHRLDPRH